MELWFICILHLHEYITESFPPAKSKLYGSKFSIKTRTFIYWWIDDSCLCRGVRRWTDSIFVLVVNGHNIYFQIATTYKSGSWLVLSYLKLFLITHFHLHVNRTWWSYFCVVNYLYFLFFQWNSILHLVQRAFSLIGPSEWKKIDLSRLVSAKSGQMWCLLHSRPTK